MIHETAVVDPGAFIGEVTNIWHFSHVMNGAAIGRHCMLGNNIYIGRDVTVGNNVKIQNNVSVYSGVTIKDDVFLGFSCVFTNISNPRSQISRRHLYETTRIRRGASIGANATSLCGVTISQYAFVAAGSVVTKNVPDYALVMGNPARHSGWMSRHGHRLPEADKEGHLRCPESGFRYTENEAGILTCLDLDEDAPLPESHRRGKLGYDSFKT